MKHTPQSQLAAGALTLALFALPLQAATTVLLNEDFSGYTTTTHLNDAGWFFRNENTNGTFAGPITLTEPIGNLSGTVFRGGSAGSGSQNTWVLKQWGGTTLTNVGDSLTLSFDAFFSGSNEFNVSFFDADQTITGNAMGGASPIAGATGYGYIQTFGAPMSAGIITSTVQSGTTVGANGDANTLRDPLSPIPTITGSAFNFSLTVTKVASGTEISFFQDGNPLSSWIDTSVSGSVELNTFKIRLTGLSSERYVDNVVLTHTTGSTIPEPSAAGVLAGIATLGFVAGRRRRR